jgi:hypothetical protein
MAGAIMENVMFNHKPRSRKENARLPDHVARVTPTLSVSVWQSHDPERGVRMHWDVSRVNGDDPARTFKTLRIESIFEFPSLLARISKSFAETEAVSPRLRSELLDFARDMNLFASRREANGPANEGSGMDGCRF